MKVPTSNAAPISFPYPTYIPPTPPDYSKYAAGLKTLSIGQLRQEIKLQEQRLYVAEHGTKYNPAMEKDALKKLALCKKELGSRAKDAYSAYARDVKKMSNEELVKEIYSQQNRLWMSERGIRYDPTMQKDAQERLRICMAVAGSRGIKVPPNNLGVR